MKKSEIKIGKKYGSLTAISDTGRKSSGGEKIYLFQCSCGAKRELRACLVGNRIKSCVRCSRKKHYKDGVYLPAIKIGKHPRKNNPTGHIGVKLRKDGKYVAYITLKQQSYYLGSYSEFEDACKAREDAELYYWGPYFQNESFIAS